MTECIFKWNCLYWNSLIAKHTLGNRPCGLVDKLALVRVDGLVQETATSHDLSAEDHVHHSFGSYQRAHLQARTVKKSRFVCVTSPSSVTCLQNLSACTTENKLWSTKMWIAMLYIGLQYVRTTLLQAKKAFVRRDYWERHVFSEVYTFIVERIRLLSPPKVLQAPSVPHHSCMTNNWKHTWMYVHTQAHVHTHTHSATSTIKARLVNWLSELPEFARTYAGQSGHGRNDEIMPWLTVTSWRHIAA